MDPRKPIDTQAAGLMLLPEEARAQGARPSWFGYVTSPDVDADVAAVVAAGGQVYRPPETLPKIGRSVHARSCRPKHQATPA